MERETISFADALRVHHVLTATVEKRLLVWMARHTPGRIGPDHLTGLAFASQLAAGAAYALSSHHARALWLVNFFLVLNWLGDSLDGTLARVRNQERPRYGFYVDHIADTFGALALIAGLGCSGYVHWQVAVGLLVCFYVLAIESYLATHTVGHFHLSHGLFGPTEIRILLGTGNAVLFVHPYMYLGDRRFLLFDFAGMVAIGAMAVVAAAVVVRHSMVLYREERI